MNKPRNTRAKTPGRTGSRRARSADKPQETAADPAKDAVSGAEATESAAPPESGAADKQTGADAAAEVEAGADATPVADAKAEAEAQADGGATAENDAAEGAAGEKAGPEDGGEAESPAADSPKDAPVEASGDTSAGDTAKDTASDGAEAAEAKQMAPSDASDETGADDGEDALSEEEQREIAEAALRDAERGYTSESAGYTSPPEPSQAEAAPAEKETSTPAAAARAPDPVAEPAPAQTVREIVVEKRGGILPGFVGGVMAVAGAVIAAPYVLPETMRPVMSLDPVEGQLAEQSDRIGTLTEQADGLSGRLDGVETAVAGAATSETVATLETRFTELDSGTTSRLAELEATQAESIDAKIANETAGLVGRIDDLAAALAQLERSPIEDATDPAVIASLEAFRREVMSLREEVAAQTAENTRVIEEAAEMTAEARAIAEAEAAEASERAAQAAQMQALADIKAALDSGLPYGEPLTLIVAEVPEALSAGQGGVATLAALQAGFSAPARAALDAARRADVGDAPAERGLTFLQSQLGMRSLAPRDGESVDAVLSRAEAATRDGDLPAAIAELQSLPEPALAQMQDWIDRAAARADAIAAADALAQSMATN